ELVERAPHLLEPVELRSQAALLEPLQGILAAEVIGRQVELAELSLHRAQLLLELDRFLEVATRLRDLEDVLGRGGPELEIDAHRALHLEVLGAEPLAEVTLDGERNRRELEIQLVRRDRRVESLRFDLH